MKKSNVEFNLFNEHLFIKKSFYTYTDVQKHAIIKELLLNNYTKKYIWHKYTGRKSEHGKLKDWMVKLGYIDDIKKRNIFAKKTFSNYKINNRLHITDTLNDLLMVNKRLVKDNNKLKKILKNKIKN